MEAEKYLERINYHGSTTPIIGLLHALQKEHLLNIPFENLDIHYKTPIELDLPKIFDKVVNNKRGGFCYELNGLFYELLRTIGFNVKMVSARVFNNEKQTFSREFDHLAIIATINSSDYLVDVGFGEFAFEPLKIELNKIQNDKRGLFRIEKYDDIYYKVSKLVDENWMIDYIFSLKENQAKKKKFLRFCGIPCTIIMRATLSHIWSKKSNFALVCPSASKNSRRGNVVALQVGARHLRRLESAGHQLRR